MLDPIRFESELLDGHLARVRTEHPIGHFRLRAVDDLIGGIHRGRLTILSAEPAMAKTTLFGQLADEAAQSGFISVVATLEIAAHQWIVKSLARMSNGELSVSEISDESKAGQVAMVAERYRNTIAPNIIFLEKAMNPVTLSATISALERETDKPIILFHDYLQILPSASEQACIDERLAVKEAVAGLRRISNVHDMPVFAISSINRTNYGKSLPDLGALGGAAAIEYSADSVLHLSVEGKGDERIENMERAVRPMVLTTLKNRYAPKATAKLSFDAAHATFTERL